MRSGESVKGWDLSGEPVELLPWQELAVRALLGWDEGERTVTLVSRAKGAGKTVVLYTAGRYARARAKGKPLRDDPIRGREQREDG
jgi:phage terminase large subunit-like protein